MKGKILNIHQLIITIHYLFCSILVALERKLTTIRIKSVIRKSLFQMTKTYIGNLGIWGAFSQGYMCMVLIFMSVQYFS